MDTRSLITYTVCIGIPVNHHHLFYSVSPVSFYFIQVFSLKHILVKDALDHTLLVSLSDIVTVSVHLLALPFSLVLKSEADLVMC